MSDSIRATVEITFYFRWQNPCRREKVEVFAGDELVCIVDDRGTLTVSCVVPCPRNVINAAREFAGWTTATDTRDVP